MTYVDIAIADRQPVYRLGLRQAFEATEGLSIVSECSQGDVVWREICSKSPDVCVVASDLKKITVRDLIERIKQHEIRTRMIVLMTMRDPSAGQALIHHGVYGVMMRSASIDELLAGVRSVAAGAIFVSPDMVQSLKNDWKSKTSPDNPYGLSEREVAVLRQIADGAYNKEIASLFNISVRTVETHRQNLKLKIGVRKATELTRVAIQMGLVSSD